MSVHKAESDKLLRHFIERTKIGWRHRAVLYTTVGAVWLTGLGWLLLRKFGAGADAFGETANPLEPLILKAHGAAAMLFMVVFGTLIPVHMRRSWALKRNRASGAVLGGLCLFLIASGWGLYYLAGEGGRAVVARLHWALGLALPAVIFAHILIWRAIKKRSNEDAPVPLFRGKS